MVNSVSSADNPLFLRNEFFPASEMTYVFCALNSWVQNYFQHRFVE